MVKNTTKWDLMCWNLKQTLKSVILCVYSTHLRWRVWRLRACSSDSCSWSRVRWVPWRRRGGWVLLPPAAGPVWRSASLKHTHRREITTRYRATEGAKMGLVRRVFHCWQDTETGGGTETGQDEGSRSKDHPEPQLHGWKTVPPHAYFDNQYVS